MPKAFTIYGWLLLALYAALLTAFSAGLLMSN